MEEETHEHVHSSVKVFKWVILPISLYVFAEFYFLGEKCLRLHAVGFTGFLL